jgi:hypothetical protein
VQREVHQHIPVLLDDADQQNDAYCPHHAQRPKQNPCSIANVPSPACGSVKTIVSGCRRFSYRIPRRRPRRHRPGRGFRASGSCWCAGESLSHEMAVSLFPNWVGQQQVRLVELDGEHLQLSTDGPLRLNSIRDPHPAI